MVRGIIDHAGRSRRWQERDLDRASRRDWRCLNCCGAPHQFAAAACAPHSPSDSSIRGCRRLYLPFQTDQQHVVSNLSAEPVTCSRTCAPPETHRPADWSRPGRSNRPLRCAPNRCGASPQRAGMPAIRWKIRPLQDSLIDPERKYPGPAEHQRRRRRIAPCRRRTPPSSHRR